MRWLVGIAVAVALAWLALAFALVVARPAGASAGDMLRVLPDALRLVRRLAGDRTLPRGVRVRLWLLLAYLALPFDLVPDFLPVIGHVDDVIVAALVLRSVIRQAGPEAVRRHWPGTPEGLAALARVARLPGLP